MSEIDWTSLGYFINGFKFNFELIHVGEFLKNMKLHELLSQQVQCQLLKNSQVQINSKLNGKNCYDYLLII